MLTNGDSSMRSLPGDFQNIYATLLNSCFWVRTLQNFGPNKRFLFSLHYHPCLEGKLVLILISLRIFYFFEHSKLI